jgi:hypothetical protein
LMWTSGFLVHSIQRGSEKRHSGSFFSFPSETQRFFDHCSTRDLRLPGFGEALKKVLVGIVVSHELKGIRMIDSTPSSGAKPQKDWKGKGILCSQKHFR